MAVGDDGVTITRLSPSEDEDAPVAQRGLRERLRDSVRSWQGVAIVAGLLVASGIGTLGVAAPSLLAQNPPLPVMFVGDDRAFDAIESYLGSHQGDYVFTMATVEEAEDAVEHGQAAAAVILDPDYLGELVYAGAWSQDVRERLSPLENVVEVWVERAQTDVSVSAAILLNSEAAEDAINRYEGLRARGVPHEEALQQVLDSQPIVAVTPTGTTGIDVSADPTDPQPSRWSITQVTPGGQAQSSVAESYLGGLTTTDVLPVADTDPASDAAPRLSLVAGLAGCLAGLALAVFAGRRRWTTRQSLGALAAAGIVTGLTGGLVLERVLGIGEGFAFDSAGAVALATFGAGMLVLGANAVGGAVGRWIAATVIVFGAAAGASGTFAALDVEGLGTLLPSSALTHLVHQSAYYPSISAMSDWIVLLVWAALGALMVVIGRRLTGGVPTVTTSFEAPRYRDGG